MQVTSHRIDLVDAGYPRERRRATATPPPAASTTTTAAGATQPGNPSDPAAESAETVAESAELVAESGEVAAELEGDAVTSMVVPAAPLALAVAEGVGVLEEGTALGDASADALGLALALGTAECFVAAAFAVLPVLVTFWVEAWPEADFGADGVEEEALAVTTVAGAPGGFLVVLLCQEKATSPPAGMVSDCTPSDAKVHELECPSDHHRLQ